MRKLEKESYEELEVGKRINLGVSRGHSPDLGQQREIGIKRAAQHPYLFKETPTPPISPPQRTPPPSHSSDLTPSAHP